MSRRWDQPGITIRLEAPSRDRDAALLCDIDALTAESGPTSVLVLLAHPLARARVLKGLLEGHPDGRLLPPLRSIGSFALEAADVDDAATPVDGGLRRSLLTELIAERRGTGPLRALSGARDLPGLVRAIDHFFQALGRQRIWTATALDTLVHVYRRGRLLRVDRDIVTLYERYRALVPRRAPDEAHSLVTPIEVMDRVAAAPEVLHRLLAGVRHVFVVGFDELSPIHASLLAAIGRTDGGRATTVVLETTQDEAARDMDWTRLFPDVPVRVHAEERDHAVPTRLSLALAAGDAETALTLAPGLPEGQLTATLHPTPDAEIKAIARHVAGHVREGGDVADVAVAFPNLERFLPLVRDVFPRHRLPFWTSAGVPLASAPPVAAMRALLSLVRNGFERAELERFLSTRLLRLPDAKSRPLLAIDTCARTARVIGGNGRPAEEWLRPIEHLTALPKARRPADEVVRDALSDLHTLFRVTAPLAALVTKRARLARFVEALSEASDALGLLAPLEGPDVAAANARDHAARARFFERLAAYDATLAHVTPTPEHRLSEWMERLDALLAEEHVRPAEETTGGVRVLGLGDLRHDGASIVFLGGLTETDVPRRPRADLLYPATRDDARDFLPRRNVVEEDARALFGDIGRRERLHLSWSATIDHVETLRSTLLDRIADVTALPSLPEPLVPPLPEDRVQAWARTLHAGGDDAPLRDPETAALARAGLHRVLVETIRRSERPSPHTGFVTDAAFRSTAGRAFAPGGTHTFSASSIETYARCGFRFFADHVLRLRDVEDVEDELTPSTRGRLLHAILRRFHAERSRRGEAVTSDRVEDIRRALHRIAEDVLSELPDDDLLWRADRNEIVGALSESTTSRRPAVLEQFVEAEIDRWADGWRPERLEWAFGMGERPAAVVRTERGDIRFRGKIDRVDRHTSGDVLVLDYKSGQTPRHRDVDDGTRFQLPLYLLAADAIVENADRWDAAYYPLRLGVGLTPQGHLSGARRGARGAVDREAIAASMRERLETLATAMAEGSFPLTFLPEGRSPCRYCAYETLCRVDASSAAHREDVIVESGVRAYTPCGGDA